LGAGNTPKSGQKGRGEDQPSPKLEMIGGTKMVGVEWKDVKGARGGVVKLWGKGVKGAGIRWKEDATPSPMIT
jgi:hypothetical protein